MRLSVSKKTWTELAVTVAVILAYVMLSAWVGKDPRVPTDATVPDEPTPSQNEEAGFVFTRYAARSVPENAELPRDKYELPLPETQRDADYCSRIAPVTPTVTSDSYFDRAVFIGDSVTEGLEKYVQKKRKTSPDFFGSAQFLAISGYGVYEATRPASSPKALHPTVDGQKIPPADFLASCGADKVYLCLGLNDIGLYTEEDCLHYYELLIRSIREKNPDIRIVIQSVTPLTLYGEKKLLYNKKIDAYNRKLAYMAQKNDCAFLDISDMLKDTDGYLAYELSSDDAFRLETEAYALWVRYLRCHCV